MSQRYYGSGVLLDGTGGHRARRGFRPPPGADFAPGVLALLPDAFYRLDDTGAGTMKDASPHGRNGSYPNGLPTKVPAFIPDEIPLATVANSHADDNLAGVVPYAAWMLPTQLSVVLSLHPPGLPAHNTALVRRWGAIIDTWNVQLGATGALGMAWYDGAGNIWAVNTPAGMVSNNGAPHLFIGVIDGVGQRARLYVDGVKQQDQAGHNGLWQGANGQNPLYVGSTTKDTWSYTGGLADVAVWNSHAITDAEALDLYNRWK